MLSQVFASSKAEVVGCTFVSPSVLVHICSIGNMSGDKLYIKLAVLHTGLPIVLSMLLLALMVLQLTKIFVYIPLGSKGSIQHKLSLWYCHTRL